MPVLRTCGQTIGRLLTISSALLLLFVLSNCGGDADDAGQATADVSPTQPAATAPPPSPTTAATRVASPTAASVPANVEASPAADIANTFDIGDRSLYLECAGSGAPTIVLDHGEGGVSAALRALKVHLATRTTTCIYDRANTGRSDPALTPRTAQQMVDDLHALLETAEVPGPYLLVGQSAGGLLVQLYTRTYPDQVVGVVSMNPVPPASPWLDEVRQIFTAAELAEEEAIYDGQNGESIDYVTSSEQVAAAPAPPAVPFELLMSTDVQCEGSEVCLKSYPTHEQVLREVATAWPRGNFTQVDAGHEIFQDDLAAVDAAIERVLAAQ